MWFWKWDLTRFRSGIRREGNRRADNSSRRLRAQRGLWVKWLKCSSTVKAEILVGRDRFSAPVAKRRNHPFQNITAGPRIKTMAPCI